MTTFIVKLRRAARSLSEKNATTESHAVYF